MTICDHCAEPFEDAADVALLNAWGVLIEHRLGWQGQPHLIHVRCLQVGDVIVALPGPPKHQEEDR
jgi:hypothetical protein